MTEEVTGTSIIQLGRSVKKPTVHMGTLPVESSAKNVNFVEICGITRIYL